MQMLHVTRKRCTYILLLLFITLCPTLVFSQLRVSKNATEIAAQYDLDDGCNAEFRLNAKSLFRGKLLGTSDSEEILIPKKMLQLYNRRLVSRLTVNQICNDRTERLGTLRLRIRASRLKRANKKRLLRNFQLPLLKSQFILTAVREDLTLPQITEIRPTSINNVAISLQGGQIVEVSLIDNSPVREVLDLSENTTASGERGLLSFVFSQEGMMNYLFAYYTEAESGASIISRFSKSDTDNLQYDSATELKLIELEQPFANHNGGSLEFGPDGFLYISLGDGGSSGDPLRHSQNLSTLYGSVLRIDVRNSSPQQPYAIPRNNPFLRTRNAKPEIFAYGVRNIWKMSFDSKTGKLWAGDVGQDTFEEVNIIRRGGNYGWNIREGNKCFKPAKGCSTQGLIAPVITYPRDIGRSITGGIIPRNSEHDELNGLYLFADFLGPNNQGGSLFIHAPGLPIMHRFMDTELYPSLFRQLSNGSILVADYLGGLYQITHRDSL